MNEVYKDDVGIIYHNDFRDIIENLNFDYIITDPPYNINYNYPDYDDLMSEDDYINMFSYFQYYSSVIIHYPEIIVNQISEGIGKVDKIISWCYNNNSSSKAHRSIAFFNCKPNFNNVKQPYKNLNDKRIKKLLENGSSGCRLYDWFNDIQLVKNVSKEKVKEFNNQIPIKLLERIILLTTKEGDIICDPFCGTSSLYFACKNTKRKYIGIDISKKHISISMKRIKKNNIIL